MNVNPPFCCDDHHRVTAELADGLLRRRRYVLLDHRRQIFLGYDVNISREALDDLADRGLHVLEHLERVDINRDDGLPVRENELEQRVEVVRGEQDLSGASWVFCGTVPE